jgi:uncharacterized membrane protein
LFQSERKKKRTTINAENIYRGTSYQPALEANMQNNNSILIGYFSLLTTHLEGVAKFNSDTNYWLSTIIATNIFFEDAVKRIAGESESLKDQLSTHKKIMATIKEIADNSKSYLNRLVGISGVLSALIELVEVE